MQIFKVTALACLLVVAVAGCGAESRTDAESRIDADPVTSTIEAERSQPVMSDHYMDIPLETISGDTTTLADIKGAAMLLVNVASECGYTPQYEGLEELHRLYRDAGLVVVGFPANNFGGQEPGTNAEILSFCQTKFDVTFQMMAKVSVKGDDKHPLFVALTESSTIPGEIEWNFSKFLLDGEGKLIARFPSKVEPLSPELIEKVRGLLYTGARTDAGNAGY